MRIILMILMISTLSACCSASKEIENRVFNFYSYYLPVFANSDGKIHPDPEKMKEYVSSRTLKQLNTIYHIDEQEIVDTDYYTYAQDYSADWIPLLKVGTVKTKMGGKYIDVWLGSEGNKTYQLGVYLRQEGRKWKIYRVKDITDNYEHYIFDATAIEKARRHAANIE